MAQYATTTDLANLALPADALAGVSAAIQNEHLLKTGGRMDMFLRSHHTLPLSAPFPDEIIEINACLAAYTILVFRGFNPDEYDDNFVTKHNACMEMLKMLASGEISLAAAADASPTVNEGRPRVFSAGSPKTAAGPETDVTRGW